MEEPMPNAADFRFIVLPVPYDTTGSRLIRQVKLVLQNRALTERSGTQTAVFRG